jgi:methylenetetrahydrofolate dehydrogenase (NADP+)/methenyltetrahydrofolate cyclohydrolase
MIKYLNGSDLAGFIKVRHARQARALRSQQTSPKLTIIQVKDDPVIDIYVNLKQRYGADIGVDVDVHKIPQQEVPAIIKKLNKDNSVHGIIVQLPLTDTSQTEEIVNLIAPGKM